MSDAVKPVNDNKNAVLKTFPHKILLSPILRVPGHIRPDARGGTEIFFSAPSIPL
jgi:hypothetical protein